MPETTIHLHPSFFADKERTLIEAGALSASVFRFDSGALRLRNDMGELVMLPFQGQQIWSAHLGGRELTMKSMFDQPYPTQSYLHTYGGFLIHCGATRMGVPGPEDDHPLHGELPNAAYQQAWIVLGEDDGGAYIGLSGRFLYTVAFAHNYVAQPTVKIYTGSTLCHVGLEIQNLKQTPMELMYLAHANFRPVDNGRLLYSAIKDAEHVRVRRSIPSHVKPGPGYKEFLDALGEHPEQHHVLAPDLVFDPEIVFNIDYLADVDGWAHTLQIHPDGSADYIRHRPDQLDVGVRWISRTPDQDALGLLLPATAEPEGYSAEKAKGNIKTIPAQGTWRCDYVLGAVGEDDVAGIAAQIERLVG
ncbi:MAG: DUF4432 family protein [Caldilineaceae bacterium]